MSFTALVGCSLPVQQAGMSRIATPALAAAVSNAGGLGMLGISRRPADLTAQLDQVAASTDKPVGASFIVPLLDRAAVAEVASRLPVIEFFYGWPDPSLLPTGAICGWQVGTVTEARAAVDAGCRYVIAQGVEAGGHVRATVALADLLPAVRAAVDVPVVAAGGLGTAAEVRAALDMGADAVRIGTRFVAAREADAHRDYVAALIAAGPSDTVLTDFFSVGWPDAPHRVLASAVAAAERADADPIATARQSGATVTIPRRGSTPPTAATTGEIAAMALYAGRSVGAVRQRQSAADIVAELLG